MGGGKTTDWTDEEEDIFVELLLESVHNGSIVKGSVNSALWVELTNRLNARTNIVSFCFPHFKNRKKLYETLLQVSPRQGMNS